MRVTAAVEEPLSAAAILKRLGMVTDIPTGAKARDPTEHEPYESSAIEE